MDHNFPEPILDCLEQFITDVTLTPIRHIDPRLTPLDDRELIIALHQLGFPAFVTSNYRMLQNPRELAAVMDTGLSVFAIEGVGHDPVRATGALLLDLPSAMSAMNAGDNGVFSFKPRRPRARDPQELFRQLADRRGQTFDALYAEVRLTHEELTTSVLS